MKRGKQIDTWFPLYIDKWLFGSTRHELIIHDGDTWIDLRGIFTDLLSLSRKDNGFIRANETTPYPISQLSGMFCVPENHLKKCIELCLKFGKLSEPIPGIFYIESTNNYALSERHKRRISEMSENSDIASAKADPSIIISSSLEDDKSSSSLSSSSLKEGNARGRAKAAAEIVGYLNEKAGKKFNPKSRETVEHISARLAEGRTVEDFKRVIDVKVAKWKGKSWQGQRGDTVNGDDLLRPSTLFRPTNFENYLNESMPTEAKKPPSKYAGIGTEV
jgi:uncharacterized phage protein (TIGR02220 family)